MNLKRLTGLCLAAPALFAVVYCGSSSSTPPTTPTPAPTVAPTPPPVAPLVCDPTPPPLRSIRVKVHANSGNRKTLDSSPLVIDQDDYCARTGQDGDFCWTRLEGHPQREDCDRMAMGMASDTGRYGPTWFFDGQPCGDIPDGGSGCNNHPDNQFLVIAKGTGMAAACAAEDVPTETGNRVCGQCRIDPASGRCLN